METKALAIHEPRALTPSTWQMIQAVAPAMHAARMFGVSSPDAAAAIMLKGYELGFSLTAAFDFIHIIQGKPELNPRGALALLHSSPLIERVEIIRIEEKGKYLGHACTITRKDGFTHTSRVTLDDAKRAGLIKPGSAWESWPENMCMWRAVGFAADVAAPDVTMGSTNLMKAPERFGVGLDQAGDVIVDPPANGHNKPTLADLTERYGAEAVMQANGGNIPGTDEEVAAVAQKLESVA